MNNINMITIMILNQDISRFSTAIQENEEKIKRLRKAKMSIENLREDLINNKKMYLSQSFFQLLGLGNMQKSIQIFEIVLPKVVRILLINKLGNF
ncbi:hypothetical protein B5V89_14165 [Heyndrickxia sporothermodurans]|uniref:hypothetical protein n=1 Tax=Heyndrickxia TaxID=2837504 RepID=UPI000D4266C7|nr:hypothetical protein [Heyndrickxia sporothermodurans]PTY77590.1 hypothetical protein B5V89_14165 [Heyndrickxia sporothermodurans]